MTKQAHHKRIQMSLSHDRRKVTFETGDPVPLTGSVSDTLALLLNRDAEYAWRTREDKARKASSDDDT